MAAAPEERILNGLTALSSFSFFFFFPKQAYIPNGGTNSTASTEYQKQKAFDVSHDLR